MAVTHAREKSPLKPLFSPTLWWPQKMSQKASIQERPGLLSKLFFASRRTISSWWFQLTRPRRRRAEPADPSFLLKGPFLGSFHGSSPPLDAHGLRAKRKYLGAQLPFLKAEKTKRSCLSQPDRPTLEFLFSRSRSQRRVTDNPEFQRSPKSPSVPLRQNSAEKSNKFSSQVRANPRDSGALIVASSDRKTISSLLRHASFAILFMKSPCVHKPSSASTYIRILQLRSSWFA